MRLHKRACKIYKDYFKALVEEILRVVWILLREYGDFGEVLDNFVGHAFDEDERGILD